MPWRSRAGASQKTLPQGQHRRAGQAQQGEVGTELKQPATVARL